MDSIVHLSHNFKTVPCFEIFLNKTGAVHASDLAPGVTIVKKTKDIPRGFRNMSVSQIEKKSYRIRISQGSG